MTTNQPPQGFRAFVRVLRNRNFFWLWVSQLISTIGDFFSFLAVPYLITVLAQGDEAAALADSSAMPTEAKALAGLATMAFTLPRLLGIFTGVFVDRWDRRKTMIVANVLAGLVVLLPLPVASLDDVWLIIAMQFLLALVSRFIYPPQQAAVRQIVSENDLLAANGLLSITATLGFIIGPLFAGLTVEAVGPKAAFLVDSASFLIAGCILAALVRIPRLDQAPSGEGARAILGNMWEGLRFIGLTRLVLATTICFALFQGGLGGVNAMWVPYMREAFGLGPREISLVDTVQGIGMALGAVALGFLMARLSKLVISVAGLLGIGIAIAALGLAPSYAAVLILSVLVGIILVPWQSAFSTILQLAIPRPLQGRVMSSYFAITQAASLIVLSGITALVAMIPLRMIYVGGGVVVILVAGIWAAWVRDDVRALENRSVEEVSEVLPAATGD